MAARPQPAWPRGRGTRPTTHPELPRSRAEVPIQRDAERARAGDELITAGARGRNSVAEGDGAPVREVGYKQTHIETAEVEIRADVELVVSSDPNVRLL